MIKGWTCEPVAEVHPRSDTLIWAKSVRISRINGHYCAALCREDGFLLTCFFCMEAAAILHWVEDMIA